jgi:hypothetical protein
VNYGDPRWKTLKGGYREAYDPTPALARLESGSNSNDAWAELWNELHHQGDVGEASYAAVPALVEIQSRTRSLGWNFYALIATIEIERHRTANPPLPAWLASTYREAWLSVLPLALDELRTTSDHLAVHSALSVVALAKGQIKLGALVSYLDESELDELLEDRLAWGEIYDAGRLTSR